MKGRTAFAAAMLAAAPGIALPGCSWFYGSDPIKDAATYRAVTLPNLIATGLSTMKAQGVEAALLDAAQKKLDAGDLKAAAALHDAALRSAEGT